MNTGKICVSVCAETAQEFIQKIKRASEIADLIELRFDCLNNSEIGAFRKKSLPNVPTITTYRPKEQGGHKTLTLKERIDFWQSQKQTLWGDFEEDLFHVDMTAVPDYLICSHHNFNEPPNNLQEIYDRISKRKPNIIKIAIRAERIADSVLVWELLQQANADQNRLVPIAMGETGKWTRILGLAHGAPLSYASLDDGLETAPGQITAEELIDVYRVKELDRQTSVYGLLGNPVSHSISPHIHNSAFKHLSINAVYIPFHINDLQDFLKEMVDPKTRRVELNLRGFSVTAPFKEKIMKYLDSVDSTASEICAVNTVLIDEKGLHGFNTDASGFLAPLLVEFPDLTDAKVAVIGAGGAARAAIYSLRQAKATPSVFARNPSSASTSLRLSNESIEPITSLEKKSSEFDIVINCTPIGTKGQLENESPLMPEQFKNILLAYDLVYNPIETAFLRAAKTAGAKTLGGIDMLLAQAFEQFEIWTNQDAPRSPMSEAAYARLKP